ncbi:MAG: amidase [Deltaproteobacteria bacterium]|nr:amidase [Deltaproteobacteria bacterium]
MKEHHASRPGIRELARKFRSGELTPEQLTRNLLERIERLNPELHALNIVTAERALEEAARATADLRAGRDPGPLCGIPYVAKDLFDVQGQPTTAGTSLLADNVAAEDCPAIRRLATAGMVLLGKTHTVQFAFGGVGVNHDQGTPKNPWKTRHYIPGGSSSGAGVAVAAGLAPVALGTDTGGSVRIPAALNGLVGLKTTVGRISRAGVYPLSWSLDSVGPLATLVEDAWLLYGALAGPEPGDETTWGIAPPDREPPPEEGAQGLRVGICETVMFDDADEEVEQAVRRAAEKFSELGARVFSLQVPQVEEIFSLKKRDRLVAAEALAFCGRLLDEHSDRLDPVVTPRLEAGRELSASEYVQLLAGWRRIRASLAHTLAGVDVLLSPTTPIMARPLEMVDASPESYAHHNRLYLRNTSVANNLGLCAVSVPCGLTSDGLPIGLMIHAAPFAEALALKAARAYETACRDEAWQPLLPPGIYGQDG